MRYSTWLREKEELTAKLFFLAFLGSAYFWESSPFPGSELLPGYGKYVLILFYAYLASMIAKGLVGTLTTVVEMWEMF